MPADIVNLNKIRKAKARAEKAGKAAENREKFGRSKAERNKLAIEEAQRQRVLDGAQRPSPGIEVPPGEDT